MLPTPWSSADSGLGANRNAWRITLLPSGILYLIVARGYEEGQVVDGALYHSDDGAASWNLVDLPEGINAQDVSQLLALRAAGK